jgi:hypothetical protein
MLVGARKAGVYFCSRLFVKVLNKTRGRRNLNKFHIQSPNAEIGAFSNETHNNAEPSQASFRSLLLVGGGINEYKL